jgi:hypothetical protein
MDEPKIPPLKARILIRSCQRSRLRRQLLAEAYQQVCPEIRLSLPENPTPLSPAQSPGPGPLAARVAAGA